MFAHTKSTVSYKCYVYLYSLLECLKATHWTKMLMLFLRSIVNVAPLHPKKPKFYVFFFIVIIYLFVCLFLKLFLLVVNSFYSRTIYLWTATIDDAMKLCCANFYCHWMTRISIFRAIWIPFGSNQNESLNSIKYFFYVMNE